MDPATAEAWFGKAPPDLSLIARAKAAAPTGSTPTCKSFYVDESRPLGWNNTRVPGRLDAARAVGDAGHAARRHRAQAQVADGEEACHKGESRVAASPASRSRAQKGTHGRRAVRPASPATSPRSSPYVGEPAALKRESMGVWVMLFLAFFTFLAYLLKNEYWRDVH